ncbi:alpha/beta fold hydrolase [Pseudonocardia spinosispora]|uniref:alpha/beta fold hydrolase n=1 Tax=Pseudonocardia spinosispora TaxID=103441 RepID=UPI000405C842|nr:alpha/beta hydrolase [Pseudonocardia spinosispora]
MTSTIGSVLSEDGTRIGFERRGTGPGLVLVHGGTADRTRWASIVPLLADRFTLYLVDRRGRGLSDDGPADDYALDREAEDLLAVTESIGEPVALLGHSYGALVSLETLVRAGPVTRALLYEPPFSTPGLPVFPAGALERMARSLAENDREGILTTFFHEAIGLDDPTVDALRATPVWQARLAAAATMVREGRVADSYVPNPGLEHIGIPVRFLLGTESPGYLRASTRAAHAAIAHIDLVEMPGQAHMAMDTIPADFAALVAEFCTP